MLFTPSMQQAAQAGHATEEKPVKGRCGRLSHTRLQEECSAWTNVRRGGGGVWHKALVVGSVSLWRRLLASRLSTFCHDKQGICTTAGIPLPLGGNPECNFCPWRPPLTA